MTTSQTIVLSAVLAAGLPAPALAADGWGASWSFGPVHPTTTNHIVHTKTTIVPGRIPPVTSTVGPLYLWPGLSNPTSDLIQTTMDAQSYNASYCGATATQWCVEASVFGSFGQRNGPAVAIDPDDHVTIEYVLGSDNNTWTQTVTSQKLGKVVSTLTSTSGLMYGGGFGFATEADANSYTIDTQYYLCTEIHLEAADPTFGATGVGGIGAMMGASGTGSGIGTIKNLHTPDNGLTWLADLITLPPMNPQGTQSPVPTYNCATGGTGGSGGAGSTGTGGTTTGSGGAGGHGGAGGTSATGGSGGTGGAGGRGGANGGMSGTAAGGTNGSGGIGSGGRTGATGGTGGTASGGANGSGGNGSGGSGSGGSGSGGQTGETGGTGAVATGGSGMGGSVNGSGGAGTGGSGEGGSASGGTAGTSTGEANGSSGCSCGVEQGVQAGQGGSLLLLGFLIGPLVRRRRPGRS